MSILKPVPQADLNKYYKLPFTDVGDSYSSSMRDTVYGYISFCATYQAYDHYSLIVGTTGAINGSYKYFINAATLSSFLVNGTLVLPTNGMTLAASIAGPSLTKEQEKELTLLQEEHKAFIKNKKIDHFKSLPAEIRQRIVNLIVVQNFIEDLKNETGSDFEKIDKLNELKAIKDSYTWGNTTTLSTGIDFTFDYQNMRPNTLEDQAILEVLRLLKKEDILKANAEVLLEEELKN